MAIIEMSVLSSNRKKYKKIIQEKAEKAENR
jgi:hypothetical protein